MRRLGAGLLFLKPTLHARYMRLQLRSLALTSVQLVLQKRSCRALLLDLGL